jgi:SAM-dependent methyltransferase
MGPPARMGEFLRCGYFERPLEAATQTPQFKVPCAATMTEEYGKGSTTTAILAFSRDFGSNRLAMTLFNRISSVLSYPALYLLSQSLMGGIGARRKCVLEYVRPAPKLVVLDIGCGPGYTLPWFPEPQYYGFDISPRYIRYAKDRYGKQGHFFCQYFEDSILEWLPPADVVLLMGLVHHLDDNEAVQLFRTLKLGMKGEGRLFTLDGCYREGQSRIARRLLDMDRGRFIRDEQAYRALAARVFPTVAVSVREDFFRVPYTTVIMECQP